jgi:hypothetical protein
MMANYRTVKEIEYVAQCYGKVAVIPKGTKCIPADNLPEDTNIKFWVEPWKYMNEFQESWTRNYGFGVYAEDVEAYDE